MGGQAQPEILGGYLYSSRNREKNWDGCLPGTWALILTRPKTEVGAYPRVGAYARYYGIYLALVTNPEALSSEA